MRAWLEIFQGDSHRAASQTRKVPIQAKWTSSLHKELTQMEVCWQMARARLERRCRERQVPELNCMLYCLGQERGIWPLSSCHISSHGSHAPSRPMCSWACKTMLSTMLLLSLKGPSLRSLSYTQTARFSLPNSLKSRYPQLIGSNLSQLLILNLPYLCLAPCRCMCWRLRRWKFDPSELFLYP